MSKIQKVFELSIFSFVLMIHISLIQIGLEFSDDQGFWFWVGGMILAIPYWFKKEIEEWGEN